MAEQIKSVQLSAVLITDAEGRFLLDFNENWGSFAFPMSKQHELPATVPGGTVTVETSLGAALRAAAEILGRPLPPASLKPLPVEMPPYNQSGRDGKWRRYSFHLFGLTIKFAPGPVSGHSAVWLTRAELETAEPISPTVRKILELVGK
jgi:hypothetical protein